jgi:hypothetical protein
LIALQRLRINQALLFLRHDSTVVKITAISDTNFVTQEIVVPPRTASLVNSPGHRIVARDETSTVANK